MTVRLNLNEKHNVSHAYYDLHRKSYKSTTPQGQRRRVFTVALPSTTASEVSNHGKAKREISHHSLGNERRLQESKLPTTGSGDSRVVRPTTGTSEF